jgi:hypothetical protein
MKLAVEIDPPRAATGGFPYAARTCAEWKRSEANNRTRPRHAKPTNNIIEREMTRAEYEKDAKQGSAQLRAAIEALNSRYPQGNCAIPGFEARAAKGKIAA